MMDGKLYATRDIIDQGEFYTRHVMAMTAEGLHDKSSIAAELAHRDRYIAELERAGALTRDMLVNADNVARAAQTDYYKARRRIAELERVLREATDDLESEIEARRPGELDRRIENDLDIVREARALLTQEGGG